MPIVLIALSVLLQAACFGYLSGRLTPSGGLLLSCVGFACSALLFNALAAARRPRGRPSAGGPRRPDPAAGARPRNRGVRPLLLMMNGVTAVTFLGFYVALAWIPATLASGLETAVGPLAVAVLSLTLRGGPRPDARAWGMAVVLACTGGALAWRLTGAAADLGWSTAAGLALAVVAGVGASSLALMSQALGRCGADPVRVTAHRFHLSYIGAAALLVLHGRAPTAAGMPLWLVPVVGVAAVTVPLFVLQVGLHRAPPLVAMGMLTTLPGVTYLSEVLWGATADPVGIGLTALMVLLAVANVTISAPRSRRRTKGQARPSVLGVGGRAPGRTPSA